MTFFFLKCVEHGSVRIDVSGQSGRLQSDSVVGPQQRLHGASVRRASFLPASPRPVLIRKAAPSLCSVPLFNKYEASSLRCARAQKQVGGDGKGERA